MFIIHGTKRVEKTLGYVADFCPACHAIRCCKLTNITLVKHLYYIPLGKGKFLQDLLICTVCGLWMGGNPSKYEKMEKRPPHGNDIEALILSTFPKLREVHAGRLAFEEELKKNPGGIEPAARAQFVFELFRMVNPQFEACYKRETRFDMQSGLGCVGSGMIFVLLLAVSLSMPSNSPYQDWAAVSAIAALVFGAIYTLAQLALVPGRNMRKKLIPMLARGLRPLDPLEAELAVVLEKCKTLGMFIGKKIKLAQIMTALKTIPANTIQ